LFLATEAGTVEVWNIEKSIRVRVFEVRSSRGSRKLLTPGIRSMVLSPDESFLAVAIKNTIAYYSTAKLKTSPSSSVYTGMETDNNKLNTTCSEMYPLNSFEGNKFDILEIGVNPKNTIFMVTRNQD
jgi:hypothetical protein